MVESFQEGHVCEGEPIFTNKIENLIPCFSEAAIISLMNLSAIESQATLPGGEGHHRDVPAAAGGDCEDLELHKDDLLYCAEHDIATHFKIAGIE